MTPDKTLIIRKRLMYISKWVRSNVHVNTGKPNTARSTNIDLKLVVIIYNASSSLAFTPNPFFPPPV